MHISDASFPVEEVWQGVLVEAELTQDGWAEAKTVRGTGLPQVSLGRPVWWDDRKILGDQWVAPAGGNRYGLARFSFSLRPADKQRVKRAEFTVHLHAKGAGPRPVVFDVFPRIITEDKTGEYTFGLGPDFKFFGLEASVAKAETKIDVKQAVTVVAADGVGESAARWKFEDRPGHPLLGSQSVFAVVALPPNVPAARASLELSVEMDHYFGPLHGLLPKTESERLSWVLE